MKVVAGGAAGRAHAADLLAASDMITLVHQNGGHVSVAGRDAAAMVDLDEIAVAATVPAGMNNGAVGSGVDRGAVGAGKIDARMEGGACAERVRSHPKSAGEFDASFDRLVGRHRDDPVLQLVKFLPAVEQ